MALFAQRLHLSPAAPTRKQQNLGEISTQMQHFLSVDILWILVDVQSVAAHGRGWMATCGATVFGEASFSRSCCPLARTILSYHYAWVLHPKRCAEDLLPICSPTYWARPLWLIWACAACMAEEMDYDGGHFPAPAVSQEHPLRCPGPMNQQKRSYALETRDLRTKERRWREQCSDQLTGRAYLNSHLLPRCWDPQPKPPPSCQVFQLVSLVITKWLIKGLKKQEMDSRPDIQEYIFPIPRRNP